MVKKTKYSKKKIEEPKLAYLNWHKRESNLRPQREAHSQISSQYH